MLHFETKKSSQGSFLDSIKYGILNVPYRAFSLRDTSTYKPTLIWLSISFVFAFICVLPFYMQWFLQICGVADIPLFLATLLGLFSIASVLFTPRERRFSVGFFIGILWFYWITLGMRYFDMSVLIPVVVILIGLFVGFVFYIILWCDCFILRFIFLLSLSYLTPLGFDWIVLESVFAYSYMGVDKLSFAFIILGLWFFVKYQSWWRLFSILCLAIAIDWQSFVKETPQIPYQLQVYTSSQTFEFNQIPLKIKLIQSNVSQVLKTRSEEIVAIFAEHIQSVRNAINEGYDVVVLPESAFYAPLHWNYNGFVPYDELLGLSNEIVIIVGALRDEENTEGDPSYFNSTFKFENGVVSFYDKVLLVPFGEYIPSFFTPLANLFFEGLGGFSAGSDFGYFDIKGVRFKNAICYEGTNKGFYADNPQYVIMTSNNAWFVPSIEPIVQKNLMKYYARLHKSIIFHATNRSPAEVIGY